MADGSVSSATGDGAPAREDITVTLQCNNHCRFCPRSALSHLRVRSEEELDQRLEAIRAHSTRVLLSGGEVTLLPDVVELVERCRRHGFEQIAIVTNGRRLADMVLARRLVDAGLTEACVSVYGLEPEVHDAMTSRPGSLVETLAGLDNLLTLAGERRSLSVRVNTLLAADNAGSMPELLRGLARRGVRSILVAEMMLSDAFPVALDHAEVARIAGEAAADPELSDSLVTWRGFPLCLFRDLPAVRAEPHDVDTAIGPAEDLDTYFAEFYRSFRQVQACDGCVAKDRCPGLQRRYLEQHEPSLVSALAVLPPPRPGRGSGATGSTPAIDPAALEAATRELAALPPWPDHARLVIAPTTACPFRCTYCNVELNRVDAAPETLDRSVDLLLTSRRDHLELQFFGGEPLIQRAEVMRTMVRAAELARRLGKRLDFVLTTSGLLLDDELLAFLHEHQAQVLFSLDGSPEVMARYRPLHRGTSDPAPIIERNLAKLIESGVRHFVNMVVTPEAAAEVPERLRYVAGLGATTVQICYTLGPGWGSEARARYCASLQRCAELIAQGEVPPIRLQNFSGAAEPTVLGTDIMVDVDGTLYGDGALFGEKVFPGLRGPYRIGHVNELESYDGLRRSREQNLVILRSTYPDLDAPPRRMVEELLQLGHEIQRTMDRVRETHPARPQPRRQLPQPVMQGHAHAVDENPLQKLVLRRSLAHQARIMKKRPELLSLPILMLENGCYHECLFCLSKPLPPTPLSEVKRWLADNESLGLERLGIAGNEPLAHTEIDTMLREARRVGFSRFEVLTSAAPLADASRARALFELGVQSYAIPLYAADAATHDAITQTPGSHADTVAAIEHLLALGADIHIHSNLLRQNLAGLGALEELVRKTWGLPLAIIPIRPKAANLPFDQLVPRYSDVVAEAKVSSLVAIPLCVAAKVQTPARPSSDIIADVLKLYVLDQPFVKPDKCQPCSQQQGCSGTFQAYLDLHGDGELEPT